MFRSELFHQLAPDGDDQHGNDGENTANYVFLVQRITTKLCDYIPNSSRLSYDGDMSDDDADIMTKNCDFVGIHNM